MERLIERARARDKDAFAALIQVQKQTMYRTARAILMNDKDAADAIQDTALACWEKIDTLREPAYFKTWLTRILINKCRDIIRRNHGIVCMEELPDAGLQAGSECFEDTLRWKEALALLPEHFRLVIALYYGEGFDTKEIADCLKIPQGTVRSRLARGREILKSYYSEQEAGSGGAKNDSVRISTRKREGMTCVRKVWNI